MLNRLTCIGVVLLAAVAACQTENIDDTSLATGGPVYAKFDLSSPATTPFPSDIFTVANANNVTGRQLAYPYPNCTTNPSDCDDLDQVNTLDGWGLQTRISVPFTGDIDTTTVTSDSLFVIDIDDPEIIGINQIVWDPGTDTLHVEVNQLLEQHKRYAVVVTKDIYDTNGKRVRDTSDFDNYTQHVPASYAAQLDDAYDALDTFDITESDVISMSVYTTQSITPVMERIRDDIQEGTPAAADFLLGPSGERAVFARSDVSSVVWRQHAQVSPPTFANFPIPLNQLDVVPGAVGTIAYGRYQSPYYLVSPGDYIPAVGTLADVPPVQSTQTVYFTLYLPSGTKPANGWPIALVAHGGSGNQHQSGTFAGAKLAASGIACIGINHVGQGRGPLGTLAITKTDASVLVVPDAGRSIDQNNDNVFLNQEGAEANGKHRWTVSTRDSLRQTAIDYLQLSRVIDAGMDVDGDGFSDIDPSKKSFWAASGGAALGAIFVALDDTVPVVVLTSFSGTQPEASRWTGRRSAYGAQLQARTPSLLNSPGITTIDGVSILGPHFNENKPLRDQSVVINSVTGAIAIQEALEFSEMAQDGGVAATWARHFRDEPLAGVSAKEVLLQMAKGDQVAANPAQSQTVRAGDLADVTLYYRHDLAFAADSTIPKNSHTFAVNTVAPATALARAISFGAQDQLAAFIASQGATIIHPTPTQYFEMPIVALPETLGYIP